jgi:hypothetical protein
MRLTLYEDRGKITNGVVGSGYGYVYSVAGLPPGENAEIALFGQAWRILRWNDTWHSNWTGEYASPEAALAELEEQTRLTAI